MLSDGTIDKQKYIGNNHVIQNNDVTNDDYHNADDDKDDNNDGDDDYRNDHQGESRIFIRGVHHFQEGVHYYINTKYLG